MKPSLFKTICDGIALAMGVAAVVINIISRLSSSGTTTLLAVGIAALGIASLQK